LTKDAIQIARELMSVLRYDTLAVLGALAEASRLSARHESAQRWTAMGERLLRGDEIGCSGEAAPSPLLWRKMQIVERCRHRAARALQQLELTTGDDPRRDLMDIATHWRELAAFADMLHDGGACASAAAGSEPRVDN